VRKHDSDWMFKKLELFLGVFRSIVVVIF
jgi:hypothetical protein